MESVDPVTLALSDEEGLLEDEDAADGAFKLVLATALLNLVELETPALDVSLAVDAPVTKVSGKV